MSTFGDVLGELEGGRTFDDLKDKLIDVVTAVKETRKPGEVTLKIKVTANGEIGMNVMPSIVTKIPEPPRAVTTFFVDDHGNLLRRDPRQRELPLRDVADPKTGELRSVS